MQELVHEASREGKALYAETTTFVSRQGIEGVAAHWVHRSSNDASQWIPGSVIEEVPQIIESLFCQELGDAVVEVGIEFVDDAFVFEDREESDDESISTDQQQRQTTDQFA